MDARRRIQMVGNVRMKKKQKKKKKDHILFCTTLAHLITFHTTDSSRSGVTLSHEVLVVGPLVGGVSRGRIQCTTMCRYGEVP